MLFGERIRFLFYLLVLSALAPVLLSLAWIRRRSFKKTDRPRVLVIPIMTRVGDLVCATTVLREIKRKFPRAYLAVAVAKKAEGIVKHNPRIDELININSLPFKGFWGRGKFYQYIFGKKFDYVIALTNDPRNTLMTLASAAPFRVKTFIRGGTMVERLTDHFNNLRFEYVPGTFLQDHYLKLLSVLGIPRAVPVKEVFTTLDGERKAERFLSPAAGDFRVGITVSAGNKIKEWPLRRFAELADKIVRAYGAKVIFIDAPGNKSRVETVIGLMANKEAALIATDFSLEEVPSLMKRLSAFIAVDTGLIYVAHALGVPLVDIIGPIHPEEQPPQDEKSVRVLPAAGIAPSSFVLTGQSGNDHARAVLSIGVREVFSAFEGLVRKGAIMYKSS